MAVVAVAAHKAVSLRPDKLGLYILEKLGPGDAVFVLAGNFLEPVDLRGNMEAVFFLHPAVVDNVEGTARGNGRQHLELTFVEGDYIRQGNYSLENLAVVGMVNSVGRANIESHNPANLVDMIPDLLQVPPPPNMVDYNPPFHRLDTNLVFRLPAAAHRSLLDKLIRQFFPLPG